MEEDKTPDEQSHDSTATMTTISRHCFGDDSETPSFCISIMENMEEDKTPDEQSHDSTATMTTISRHCFGDDSETPSFCISIIENMKEDYGLFVWPCSIVLAEYIWQQKHRFSGATVLELGAGTSLPGLVAARVGAHVTLTDDLSRVEVLHKPPHRG